MMADMLVKAGVLQQDQVDECVRLAGNKRLSVGQMLIMAGYLSNRQLEAAMDAQTAIDSGTLEQADAVKFLNISCRSEMTFKEVIESQQQSQVESGPSGDGARLNLAPLLLAAGVVQQVDLDIAEQRSNSTGLPIGRILALNGAVNEKLLGKALDLVVRMRDEGTEIEDAVEALRAAAGLAPGTPGTQNLLIPPRRKKVRLGELMLIAEIMTQQDILSAVEIGLLFGIPIGQVMIEQGYVSEYMVEAALELQDRVEADQVSIENAAGVLRKVAEGSATVMELMGAAERKPKAQATDSDLTYDSLITLSRMVAQEQINDALDRCRKDPELLSGVLFMTNILDERRRNASLRCFELVQKGRLTKDDAIVALDYCVSAEEGEYDSFDDAIRELGWTDALEGEDDAPSQEVTASGAFMMPPPAKVEAALAAQEALEKRSSQREAAAKAQTPAAQEQAPAAQEQESAAQEQEPAAEELQAPVEEEAPVAVDGMLPMVSTIARLAGIIGILCLHRYLYISEAGTTILGSSIMDANAYASSDVL